MSLNKIQEKVGRGEYRVDAQAVAEAIVRRLLQGQIIAEPKPVQGECS